MHVMSPCLVTVRKYFSVAPGDTVITGVKIHSDDNNPGDETSAEICVGMPIVIIDSVIAFIVIVKNILIFAQKFNKYLQPQKLCIAMYLLIF